MVKLRFALSKELIGMEQLGQVSNTQAAQELDALAGISE
jgi:hypothetical protein